MYYLVYLPTLTKESIVKIINTPKKQYNINSSNTCPDF